MDVWTLNEYPFAFNCFRTSHQSAAEDSVYRSYASRLSRISLMLVAPCVWLKHAEWTVSLLTIYWPHRRGRNMCGHPALPMSWTWMLCVAHNERRTLHVWSFLWYHVLDMNARCGPTMKDGFYTCGHSSDTMSWTVSEERWTLHVWSFFWYHVLDMNAMCGP